MTADVGQIPQHVYEPMSPGPSDTNHVATTPNDGTDKIVIALPAACGPMVQNEIPCPDEHQTQMDPSPGVKQQTKTSMSSCTASQPMKRNRMFVFEPALRKMPRLTRETYSTSR